MLTQRMGWSKLINLSASHLIDSVVGKQEWHSLLLWSFLDDTHLDILSVLSLLLALGSLLLSSFSLFLELGLADLLLLHLVDGLDKNGLVLVEVTLGGQVEVMEDVLGDFLSLTVLFQKSSEDSLSSHPKDLGWHTGIGGTLSLTVALVATLSLGLMHSLASRAGVHLDLTSHDETILNKFADVLA